MAALVGLSGLIGNWQGTYHLWLSPEDPVRKSESSAEIKPIAQHQFTEIRYFWANDGKPQEGLLIIGQEAKTNILRAIWFDTWHMREQFMVCEGAVEENGTVCIKGSYAAPPGPDWEWEITIEPKANQSFDFL